MAKNQESIGETIQRILEEGLDKAAQAAVARAEESSRKVLEEDLDKSAKAAITRAGEIDRKEAKDFYGRSLKEYEKARLAVTDLLKEADAKKKEIEALALEDSHTIESGCATLDGSGTCFVYLSKGFAAAAGGKTYQVFIQAEAEGHVFVEKKTDSVFTVKGDAGIPFSWMVRVN